MISITALLWITSTTLPIVSTSHCRTILNVPSGLNNFDLHLPPDLSLDGIITVEGVLDSSKSPESGSGRVPDRDFLKFLAQGDTIDTPLLNLETQVRLEQQCMFASGTVRDEMSSSIVSYPKELRNREDICSIDYKISSSDLIKLQISTQRVEGYLMYLRSLDGADLMPFIVKYGSSENWGKFSNRRLNSTRRIINDCNQECRITYTRISVCSDATVDLKDEETIGVFRAEVGETYTLFCIGTGAPYLTTEWRDKDDNLIPGHTEVASYGDKGDFQIVSKLVIPSFELNQTGDYTCNIFNKFFQTRTEKVISLHSLVILSSPNITNIPRSSETLDLDWTVQGWPLGAVQLRCETENETLDSVQQYLEGFPPKLRFTVTVPPSSNFVVCVMMNGTEVIRQYVISNYDSSEEGSTVREDDRNANCDFVIYLSVLLAFSLCFNAGMIFHKFGWPKIRSCLKPRLRSLSGNAGNYYNSLLPTWNKSTDSDADSQTPASPEIASVADANGNINEVKSDNGPGINQDQIQAGADGIGSLGDQPRKSKSKGVKKRKKFKKKISSAPASF